MGTVLEFYATHKDDLIAAWITDDDKFFEQRFIAMPHADFSLHLLYPKDLNALWQSMHAVGVAVPTSFVINTEQVWSNGVNEYIFRLMPQAVETIAQMSQQQLLAVATAWKMTFPANSDSIQPIVDTAIYQPLVSLHTITNIALQQYLEVFLLLML